MQPAALSTRPAKALTDVEYSASIRNLSVRRTPVAKDEKTSKEVASKAGKVLRDPKSTKTEKSVAASALTQAADKPKTAGRKVKPPRPITKKH